MCFPGSGYHAYHKHVDVIGYKALPEDGPDGEDNKIFNGEKIDPITPADRDDKEDMQNHEILGNSKVVTEHTIVGRGHRVKQLWRLENAILFSHCASTSSSSSSSPTVSLSPAASSSVSVYEFCDEPSSSCSKPSTAASAQQ